jgi:hypothetical protein
MLRMFPATVKMSFFTSLIEGHLLVLWENEQGGKEYRNVPLELEEQLRKNYAHVAFSDKREVDPQQ